MRRGDLWLRDVSVVTDDPGEELKTVTFLLEVPGEGKVRIGVDLDETLREARRLLDGVAGSVTLLSAWVEVVERRAAVG